MKRCLLFLFFLLAVFCLCSIDNDVYAYDFSSGHYIQNVIRSKLEMGIGDPANFTEFFLVMNNNSNMFWNIYKDAFGNGNIPSYFPANFDITKYDCFVYSINSGSTNDSSNYRYNVIWINTVDHLDSIDYIKFDEQSGTMHAYAYEYSQNDDIDVNFGAISYFSMCVWLQQDGQVHLYNHYGPFTPTTDNVSDIFNCSIYDFNKIYYYGDYDVYNTDGSTLYSLETGNTRPLPGATPDPDVPVNPGVTTFDVSAGFTYTTSSDGGQDCGYRFSLTVIPYTQYIHHYEILIELIDSNGISSVFRDFDYLTDGNFTLVSPKFFVNNSFVVTITGYDYNNNVYSRIINTYTSNYHPTLACNDVVVVVDPFPEDPSLPDVFDAIYNIFDIFSNFMDHLPWFISYPLLFLFSALVVIMILKFFS